jgi:uncharacterized phage-associated protein
MESTMPHSSLAIANEFIERAKGTRSLTHMQVQKLVYLAHGWNLAAYEQSLIEDDIEAWEFGPVIRRLYDALRIYGRGPITKLLRWGDDTPFKSDDYEEAFAQLTPEEIDIIDLIWEKYGSFPAFKLSALTHENGTPWFSAFSQGRNKVINNDAIRDYFAGKLAAA